MVIFVCYCYDPFTTGGYLEKAFRIGHEVYYIGLPSASRPGYLPHQDLTDLITIGGLPQPDLVVFIDSPGGFFPKGLEKLPCPTACYLIDVHQGFDLRAQYAYFFDFIFCAQKSYVDHLKKLKLNNVFWLPLACDPEIHGKRELPKIYDIGFVGNWRFPRRLRLLTLLAHHFTLNDFRRVYPKEQIATIYSQSKLVFNCSVNGDLNMRIFEALASGSMLITDRIDNGLDELFKDGVHLVTYQDEDSLLEQVKYYLEHEAERESIAMAGMQLVLAHHTYSNRVQTILDTVFRARDLWFTAKARSVDLKYIRKTYAKLYAMLGHVDLTIDEFASAWREKAGRLAVACRIIEALGRRLNRILKFTLLLRKLAQKRLLR